MLPNINDLFCLYLNMFMMSKNEIKEVMRKGKMKNLSKSFFFL